jgi:COP9 signalosome complex subunit 3
MYHYMGGVVLAVLKKWAEAEEYFEICVTAPGAVPAALQLEALKKLRLVQLISRGEVSANFLRSYRCDSMSSGFAPP